MNRTKLDKFIESDYYDLLKRVNKKVNDITLTRELMSKAVVDSYKRIDNPNHEKYQEYCVMVTREKEMRDYLIDCCLHLYGKYWNEFLRTERPFTDTIVEVNYEEDYDNDIAYDETDREELLAREKEIDIQNENIAKYYTSLPMPKQILFELLYIERLNGRAIHKLLNQKLKLSESHIYTMIREFKQDTIKALTEC